MWFFTGFVCPAGFDPEKADLLLRLQPGYPDVPPDMWWFDPPVRREDGQPIPQTEVIEHYLGRGWQRWSRHLPAGQWRSGIDGLESFLALLRKELERCVNGVTPMTTSVVIPQDISEELQSIASFPKETAGVMLAGVAEAPNGDIRVLARSMRWVKESAYSRREWYGLTIQSEGYVHALAEAETLGAACIWVHTHPGQDASPRPSKHDRTVDDEIADLFRLRSGSPYYGTLIFSPHSPELGFTGYLQREGTTLYKLNVCGRSEIGGDWSERMTPQCLSYPPFSTVMCERLEPPSNKRSVILLSGLSGAAAQVQLWPNSSFASESGISLSLIRTSYPKAI